MSSNRRLLNLLDSAQTTLGEAVQLILTSPHLENSLHDEAGELAQFILRIQHIADDLSDKGQQKSA